MLGVPVGEGCRREDAEVGVHAVMACAAELGAEDCVSSRLHGREVDVNRLTGNGILLEAHLGDSKAMDDVLRVEA